MILKVEVSEKCLKNGLRKSYTHDPICLGIREAVKQQYRSDCKVQIMNMDFGFINGWLFWLPEQVRTLMKMFDEGKPCMPIIFTLEGLPDDLFSNPKTGRK